MKKIFFSFILLNFLLISHSQPTSSTFIQVEEYGLHGLFSSDNRLYVVSQRDKAYSKSLSSVNSGLEIFDLNVNNSDNGIYGYGDICKIENQLYISKPYNGMSGVYRYTMDSTNPDFHQILELNGSYGLANRGSFLFIKTFDSLFMLDLSQEDSIPIEILPNISYGDRFGIKVYDNFLYISNEDGLYKTDLEDEFLQSEIISEYSGRAFAKDSNNNFYLTDNGSYNGSIYSLNLNTQEYSNLLTLTEFYQVIDIEYFDDNLYVTGLEGQSNKVIQIQLNSLGTIEQHAQEPLILFPNPVKDILNINNLKHKVIQIITPNGQLVKKVTLDKNQIDVSDLANGVYFLKSKNIYSRFIKN